MPNGFHWRPIQTISQVDPEIPVLSLGDDRDVEARHFILVNDEQRRNLSWLLNQAEVRKNLLVVKAQHRRFLDTWQGRVVAIAGLLAGLGTLIDAIHNLAH